jgi:S1-C subfamily serine protease
VSQLDGDVVIVDAQVYPGMAGAPLLDNAGRVVAIVRAIREPLGGLAIRSDTIMKYLQSIHIPVST